MNERQNDNAQMTGMFSRPHSDASALKIRLETRELHDEVERYLRGKDINYGVNNEGQLIAQTVVCGKPKANEQGIQGLMRWLRMTINPHTVQGNFMIDKHHHSEKYEQYIEEYHIELTKMIIINSYDWGIKDNEIDEIISSILLLVQPFMTRLIGNKERDSYSNTMRTIQSESFQSKHRGGMQVFRPPQGKI